MKVRDVRGESGRSELFLLWDTSKLVVNPLTLISVLCRMAGEGSKYGIE